MNRRVDLVIASSYMASYDISSLFTNVPPDFTICLLNRYFRICSLYDICYTEVLKLKSIFLQNGTPLAFFENSHSKFLHKIFPSSDNNPAETDNERTIVFLSPAHIL